MGDISELINEYRKQYPDGQLRENEPMSRHTSFRIGGRVRALFIPQTAEEAGLLLRLSKELGVRRLIMGNGTNLLVNDGELDMIVIKTADGMTTAEQTGGDGTELTAGSGIMLSKLATFALECGLTGLEFAHGIPGTLGGAVSMNAGAYGGEIKDVLRSVKVLENGEVREYTAEECELSYRHSRFSDTDAMILSAVLRLKPGEKNEIKAKMDELSAKRRKSQPLNLPSAGSTFKRPQNGYAAAMIEEAGLKGCGFGGAQVSEKHAGFVVNCGGATFEDVIKTMELIQDTVYKKNGVMLAPEVKIIR